MRKIYLSVVIPAYNEEHNLKANILSKVYNYLKKQKYTWEVIIADDGSTDKTAELVLQFCKSHKGFRILKEPHRGKAGTVIAGVLKAKGKFVLFTDMDQSTPLNQIEKFFGEFEKGRDIVIGSRKGRKGAPLIRKIMAFGFVILRSLILRLPYRDTQAGFKALKYEAAQKIFTRLEKLNKGRIAAGASVTAGFDLELLYLARKLSYKVSEIPVDWQYEEGAKGKSAIKNSIDDLKGIISIRINALKGAYKA